MKSLLTVCALMCASSQSFAEDVFRIEVGKDYQRYSDSDLRRRVWELERAVWQLQQRVFQLEVTKVSAPTADTWLCTVKAMGNTYTATGPTKAVASNKVLEACKSGNKDDGFFCKEAKCEQ